MPRRKKPEAGQPTKRRKALKPKTKNQEGYIRTISENDVTFCTGPAGTGKTAVGVGLACDYLLDKRVSSFEYQNTLLNSCSTILSTYLYNKLQYSQKTFNFPEPKV